MLCLVVPSGGIAEAEDLSVHPFFVAQARVPAKYLSWPYGFISRQPKGSKYVDVWKLAEAVKDGRVGFEPTEDGAVPVAMEDGGTLGPNEGIGDDGVLRWVVCIGRSGQTVFEAGINARDNALADALQYNGQVLIPDAIVLVAPQDLNDVQAACTQLGIETVVHSFDGQLALDRSV